MGVLLGASGGGSWRRALTGRVAGVLVAAVVALVAAAMARAEVTPPSPYFRPRAGAGVAVLANGVVWAKDHSVLYQGFWSPSRVLGGLGTTEPVLASSAKAVVVARRGSREPLFSGAVPPGRLGAIDQIWAPQVGAGCEWLPSEAAAAGGFAVAGDELLDGASCAEELAFQEQVARQPLFVRNVRGGEWHVLRWLAGRASPVLATEGDLLAVGVRSSA